MGKSDQNQAKSQAKEQITQNNTNESSANQQLQSIFNTAGTTASTILPGITGGYSDLANTGGAVDPNATVAYQKLAGGTNVSEDLLATGGISPDQATAIRNRASEAARSTYQTSADQASRTAAATGGYGDTSAVQAKLARQGSEAASKAATDSDASIAGLEQQGRLQALGIQQSGIAQGASGLSQTAQNVTANKLAALSGSTNIYGMNEQQMNTTVDQILKNYQQTGQMNAQDLAILTNLANQPGVFDKVVSTIGTLGGAAAGIIGALKP